MATPKNQFDAVTRVVQGVGGAQSVVALSLPVLPTGRWYRTTELTNVYRDTNWVSGQWRAIVKKYSYIANQEV